MSGRWIRAASLTASRYFRAAALTRSSVRSKGSAIPGIASDPTTMAPRSPVSVSISISMPTPTRMPTTGRISLTPARAAESIEIREYAAPTQKPVPIALVGYTGEVASALAFDLFVVGFATVAEEGMENLVAMGSYVRIPNTGMAEVALVVRDDWQNKGLGTKLLEHLIDVARAKGFKGFTAWVLTENAAMMHVFRKLGHKLEYTVEGEVYHVTVHFQG